MDLLEDLLNQAPRMMLVPDYTRDRIGLGYQACEILKRHLPLLAKHKAWTDVRQHLRNAIHVSAVFRLSYATDLHAWLQQRDLLKSNRAPQEQLPTIEMLLARMLLEDGAFTLQRALKELEPVLYAYSSSQDKGGTGPTMPEEQLEMFLLRVSAISREER
ncbi:MAG: hypothetical protein JSS77_12635 [Acidobacteria bacterium]|nr:hypothetical protein [Acidobacteriota bacterium]